MGQISITNHERVKYASKTAQQILSVSPAVMIAAQKIDTGRYRRHNGFKLRFCSKMHIPQVVHHVFPFAVGDEVLYQQLRMVHRPVAIIGDVLVVEVGIAHNPPLHAAFICLLNQSATSLILRESASFVRMVATSWSLKPGLVLKYSMNSFLLSRYRTVSTPSPLAGIPPKGRTLLSRTSAGGSCVASTCSVDTCNWW